MYNQLFEHLNAISFDFKKDRCFSCGDLIDRGPDSEKCISLIYEPWFYPVLGNHEACLIYAVRNPSSAILADWILNGGRWHLMVSSALMNHYAEELDELPLLIEVKCTNGKRVAICHAEYPLTDWNPKKIGSDQALIHHLQWSRSKYYDHDETIVEGVDYVICGHTIVAEPLALGNTIFIDTGCFKTGRLTVLPIDQLP